MASPNFVYAWRLLSGSKADLIPLGARNPRNFYTADGDHTPLLQSLDDIRLSVVSGSLFGFAPQQGTPSAISGSAYSLFVTGSSNDLFYNKNGTLIRITLGSGLGSDVVSASVDYVGGIQIDTSAAADGRVLRFDGTKFVAATLTGSGGAVSSYPILTGTLFLTSVMTGSNALFSILNTAQLTASNGAKLQGVNVLPGGAADGQVLRFNGTAFVPATLTGSGGGTSTLSGSYAFGTTSADSTIQLTSQLSGVLIRDARPSISGSGGFGGTLFGIQDRPGTKKYLDIVVSGSHTLKSDMVELAGGPSFVLDLDTDQTLASVTSRWLRFKNAGVVQGGFGFHPVSNTIFGWQSATANTHFIASDQSGFTVQSGVTYFYNSSTAYVAAEAGKLRPFADVGTDLGDSTHHWNNLYAKTWQNGSGPLTLIPSAATFPVVVSGSFRVSGSAHVGTTGSTSIYAGGERVSVTNVFPGPYTVLASDYIVAVTGSTLSASVTMSLPNAAPAGTIYIIKDATNSASFSAGIHISASLSKIDYGTNGVDITTRCGVVGLYSDGNNYFTI